MWKVCLLYSNNNKIVWLFNMGDTFLRNLLRAQRFVGFFVLIVLFGCWLAKQTSSGHMVVNRNEKGRSRTAKFEVCIVEIYNSVAVQISEILGFVWEKLLESKTWQAQANIWTATTFYIPMLQTSNLAVLLSFSCSFHFWYSQSARS